MLHRMLHAVQCSVNPQVHCLLAFTNCQSLAQDEEEYREGTEQLDPAMTHSETSALPNTASGEVSLTLASCLSWPALTSAETRLVRFVFARF